MIGATLPQVRQRLVATFAAAAALAVALVAITPAPAQAACNFVPSVSQALAQRPIAFVGEVQSVSEEGRVATIEVLEIWKGEGVSRYTRVWGYDVGAGAELTPDQWWAVGSTYLVIPETLRVPFVATACSGTVEFTPEGKIPEQYVPAVGTAQVRFPLGVTAESASAEADASGGLPWMMIALGALVLGFIARRKIRLGSLIGALTFEGAIGRSGNAELNRRRKGGSVGHTAYSDHVVPQASVDVDIDLREPAPPADLDTAWEEFGATSSR